jgi:hypothetical protein
MSNLGEELCRPKIRPAAMLGISKRSKDGVVHVLVTIGFDSGNTDSLAAALI